MKKKKKNQKEEIDGGRSVSDLRVAKRDMHL